MEHPDVRANIKRLRTNITWVARDTADMAFWLKAASITVSDRGTSANIKFCSVMGRIREISLFVKVLSFVIFIERY
jgi:hypothetical protein